jgi:murein DD-endopeptidase MepM/ murein hydrolase activator NlpD
MKPPVLEEQILYQRRSKMAKNDFEDMNFDFDEASFDAEPTESKKSFFKDLAKGLTIGAVKKIGTYMPPVQETVESAGEMNEQMRDQFQAVKMQANKIGSYAKGVTDDVRSVIREIKETKGLKEKITAAEKGFDKTKKNLAYAIDPETAEAFDFDKMFGDDGDFEDSSSAPNASPPRGSTEGKKSDDQFIRERDEMLNIGGTGGLGGFSEPFGSGFGGSKGQRSKKQTIVINSGGAEGKTGEDALRESIIVSNARIIANQNKLFKQQFIIDTKRHLQIVHIQQQIADATTLSAKFNAELLGPSIKQYTDYFAKYQAQFTDMIDLLRSDNPATGIEPIKKAFANRTKYSRKSMTDFMTASGGVDLGALYKHGTGQVKELGSLYGLDSIKDMASMIPMMLMGGGGGANFAQTLGKLVGGAAMMPFKKQFTKLSQSISDRALPTMLDINERMKNSSNPMFQQIAELMNIDTGTKSTVDLSTKNRRVPFDMVTRRSIIEVIPGLLGDIHQAIAGGEKKVFDHKTGQFTTERDMRNRIQSDIDRAGLGSVSMTKYAMKNTNFAQGGATGLSQADFDKGLDTIFRNLMISGEVFNRDKLRNDSFRGKLTKGLPTGKENAILAAFANAYDQIGGTEQSRLNANVQFGRDQRRREIVGKELELLEYGGGTSLGNSAVQQRQADIQRRMHNLDVFSEDQKKTEKYNQFALENAQMQQELAQLQNMSTSLDSDTVAKAGGPLQKIYDLLLGGIYVFPRAGKAKHIEAIQKTRADEASRAQQREVRMQEAQSMYESAARATDETQAQNIRDARERQGWTFFDKLMSMPGAKTIAEKTGLADAIQRRRESGQRGFFGRIVDKVRGGLDNASQYVENRSKEGTFDISGIASDAVSAAKAAPGKIQNAASNVLNNARQTAVGSVVIGEAEKRLAQFQKTAAYKKIQEAAEKAGVSIDQFKEKAKTKEGQKELRDLAKGKVEDVVTRMKDGLDKGKEVIVEKLSPDVQKALDSGTVKKDSFINNAIKQMKSGDPVSYLIGQAKILGAKLNTALFGSKEDPKDQKKGLINRVIGIGQKLMTGVVDFLLGQKDGKRWGLLYKIMAPGMRFFETFRHQFMSKIGIPFKAIAQATGKQIKWMIRDVKSNIGFMAKGLGERFQKLLNRKSKENKPYSAGLLGGVQRVGNALTGAATGIVGGVMNFGFNQADRNMKKLVAQGKMSQEEYDEWRLENDTSMSNEDKRHTEAKSKLDEYEKSLISYSAREKIQQSNAAVSELEKKKAGMSYADMKAERKTARSAASRNKKMMKSGEWAKLTPEQQRELQMEALTTDQKIYRERDDAVRAAGKAAKDQQLTLEKEKFEMEQKQTDALDKLAGAVNDQDKAMTVVVKEGKTNVRPSVDHDANGSGHEDGSLHDLKEEERKKTQDEANKALVKLLPVVAAAGSGTQKAVEQVDKNTDELEKNTKNLSKEGGPLSNILGMLKNVVLGGGTALAGAGMATAGALPFVAAANQAGNVVNRFREDGVMGGLGEITGLDSAGDSNFNADGTRKNVVQDGMDSFKAVRFGIKGGYKASAGLVKRGVKTTGKGLSRMLIGTTDAAGNVTRGLLGSKKSALVKGATDAAKGAGSKIMTVAKNAIDKVLSLGPVKKFVSAATAKKIAAEVGQEVAKRGAKAALKGGLKTVLGVLSGGIGTAIFAAADFASGMANAPRYFKIPPGAEMPMGARIAAGVATALSGLVMGIIPEDWLAKTIYNLVASDADKANMKGMQDAQTARAEQLSQLTGVAIDPEKLNEVEQRTWGQKFMDWLPGGGKRKAKREAQLLGMTDEQYDNFIKQKEALDKGEVESLRKEQDLAKAATAERFGITTGAIADQALSNQTVNHGSTDAATTISLATLGAVAKRKGVESWLMGEANKIVSGEQNKFSDKAIEWLWLNHLGTKLTWTKDEEVLARGEEGLAPTKAAQAQLDQKIVTDDPNGTPAQKKTFAQMVGQTWGKLKNFGEGVAETAGRVVGNIQNAFETGIGAVKKGANYVFSGQMWDDVTTKAKALKDNVVAGVTGALDAAKKGLTSAWEYVSSGKILEDIKNTAMNVANGIGNFAKGAFEKVKGGVQAAWGGVKNFFGGIGEGISNFFGEVGAAANAEDAKSTTGYGAGRAAVGRESGGDALSDIFASRLNSIGGISTGSADASPEAGTSTIQTSIGELQTGGVNAAGKVIGMKIPIRKPDALAGLPNRNAGVTSPGSRGAYVTETFGRYSDLPNDHYGIDVGNASDPNATNNAISDGKVIRVVDGWRPNWGYDYFKSNKQALTRQFGATAPFGNHVTIQDKNGAFITYAHQQANFVKPGDSIKEGQPVGIMGNTGNSMGKHLHLQIFKGGKVVDPIEYLALGGRVASGANLTAGTQSQELTKSNIPTTISTPVPRTEGAPMGGLFEIGGENFNMPSAGVSQSANAARNANTSFDMQSEGPPSLNKTPLELTSVPSDNSMLEMNKKIGEALTLKNLTAVIDSAIGTLHSDNTQIINILLETMNMHKENYQQMSPMLTYFRSRNNISNTQMAAGNALNSYTGGNMDSQGIHFDMEVAPM